ncbi:MAG TPA: efflux RND transporter periplasmic adaptor subunit [Acetomicrobium flavidum]|uniref:efflux RND transporter periplasmic adaptor subunit n=1 Tax=Acetomicrobium flavidum TaxID=49896 RepID=UPI002BDFD0CB|nr:efflux RND transporter periplasmic adaptor subunit [Acetomicrobium flavidum]HPP13797.1 efflux RND transporter periplasmic adaptor subunit [Acetomicrobium flavidum]
MKIKTIVIAIVALAVVAVAGTRLFNENKTNDQSDVVKPLESIKVSVVKPTVMQFEDIVTFVGGVEPKEAAIVGSKVTSNVTVLDVFVDIGDQVKQGQLLARLDDSLTRRQIEEARAAVAAAKASISQAKSQLQTTEKDYVRYKNLYQEQVISRQQLDQIEGQYEVDKAKLDQSQRQLEQAEAQLRQLQVMMSYHDIVSPVNGVIAERNIDPGDTVGAGTSCFVVSRQETVKIKGTITESDYPKVRLGQLAHVTIDAFPGVSFDGSVSRLSPTLDASTRTANLEVWIPSKGILKPGMFARVEVVVGKHDGIALPKEAVKQLAGTGEWYCFIVGPDKKAKQIFVKRGIETGNLVEIIEGVSAEDRVISPVVRALGEGVPVEVVTQ